MKKEEQVILIMKLISVQRKKNPSLSDTQILKKVRITCETLISDEDLDKDVVDMSLALIFKEEKDRYENSVASKAIEALNKKKADAEAERERKRIEEEKKKEKELKALKKRLAESSSYDPCSAGSYRSPRGGVC